MAEASLGVRARRRIFHGVTLLTRAVTLGVRGLALDPEGRVFLVRHTYMPGWHLPGGAVDRGETAAEALVRELREEGNLELPGPPELVGIHLNRRLANRDHVVLFLARQVRQSAPRRPDREIAESGFFSLDALPEGTTPATRRRLAEFRTGAPPAPEW